ncbi:hypothetical protein [Clostridium rhizosphaerae]|nr:hypothetical protein [Clostridium rhizosphaerae]
MLVQGGLDQGMSSYRLGFAEVTNCCNLIELIKDPRGIPGTWSCCGFWLLF